jgi:uncharacterized oxidoreductase
MNLSGNTILITGGTSGIGHAFAEAFAAQGNKVMICGRRKDRLDAIRDQHPEMITYACDITDASQREELARWATTEHPDLNVVMNNAGVQLATDLTHPVDMDSVRQEIETNLVAPIHLASLFAPHLKTKERPVLINISSGLAFVPLAFMPVYCATKAAMHSFTMSLRHQFSKIGIQVIEIAPPSTDTELGHGHWAGKQQSHGGLPIADFIREAMDTLATDKLEIPVADAKGLRDKGEAMFPFMNK